MSEQPMDVDVKKHDPKSQSCEDWRELLNIQARNQYMLDHSIGTDCSFVVGPEDGITKEFKLHRFLLCNASAVFERMLNGEMSEALTGNVRIIDINTDTFQHLVR
jgi:hypothetical protein